MTDRGKLEKLTIQAYKDEKYTGKHIDVFDAYVNPAELTLSYEMEYDAAQGAGSTASRMEFKKIKPGDLSLSFFLDGTGANGTKIVVQDQVAKFQKVTGFNGDIHRPNYLIVAWGKVRVRRCVLKSASIAYKLFQADGTPLRAVISATFTDNSDDATRVALEQNSSADLTHRRRVHAGDTLPGLCNEVYGNPHIYLEVARANKLDHFRELSVGSMIYFPPVEN